MTKIASIGMLSFIALAVACGATTTTTPGSGACNTDADCGSGEGCAFASTDGCGAKGKCLAKADVVCAAYSPGCACDGSSITVICTGFADGFVSKPLKNKGECNATDGGSRKACNSDIDCVPGEACAFAIAEGCAAQGKCLARAGATCEAYSPGCACDGSEVTTICTGLADGFVSKPLKNKGACTDAGPDATTD